MTEAEFKKILDDILPSSVDGMVRPTNPIPTDLPFSTDFPQLLQADMNLANHENAFLRRLFSNDKLLKTLLDALQKALTDEDFKIVTEEMKGLMTPEMLKKLNGIADKANNYSHPTGAGNNHIPSGGATGQVLKWLSNGVARWVAEYSYTHPSASGNKHIPSGGSNNKILRWAADGTAQWGDDVNTWRGIVNALNSISTTDSLSAAQGKWLNDNKANTVNAALTGTPTAPTPATADNSTKIATTAFVLNLINSLKASGGLGGTAGEILQPNGWTKFSNGLILQWGRAEQDFTTQTFTYPIAFTAYSTCIVANTGPDQPTGSIGIDNGLQNFILYTGSLYNGFRFFAIGY